jgi:hypothetical protein
MEAIRHLLGARLALWGLAIVLALFGVGNVFVALFVPARFEVIYEFDVTVSYCAEGQCAFSALLEVANSGREMQEEVVVTLKGLPANLGGAPRTLNLDSSYPRSGDPAIRQQRDGDTLKIQLQQFSPGSLTQFHFSGSVPRSRLNEAVKPDVQITGRGRIIEGDPRSIAFTRWFTHLKTGSDPHAT